ncbi:unnamed protein product [Nippostrongylus brasiliensis]|uniref:DUF2127 domain-containing protein n=1 Tax=Nippostrongylus brasiliensis TaxID=27835 RepID=A0A0N4Y4E9_NIPBR|nr:unnamed protein product [Nippostrongylus brasiliensis]
MLRGVASARGRRSRPIVRVVTKPRPLHRIRDVDFLNAVLRAIGVALRHPLFVVTLLLAVGFNITFKNVDAGPISSVLPKDSTNSFVKWPRSNIVKVAGYIIFVPVIVDASRGQQASLALVVAVWVSLVPEAVYVEYAIQAVALHLFFHLRSSSHRLVIVAIVIVAYFSGFILSGVGKSKSATSK